MKISTSVLIVLVILILAPQVQAAYLLRAVAADSVTSLDINPATFTINGQTLVGTPRAEFPSVPAGTPLTLKGSASGYQNRTDDQFYDANLQSCVNKQTCALSSTVLGQTFGTQCGFSATFGDYECNVTNSNVRVAYFFKPSENRVTYIQLLTPNSALPNNPPSISFTGTPLSGSAPLSVSFMINASDDESVQSVTILFGDGASQSIPANAQIIHSFASQGSYVATVQAFDNKGASSSRTLTVTVSAPAPNAPPSITASASPLSGNFPLSVTFDAAIADSDGIANATWFFGDGSKLSVTPTSQIAHSYSSAGTFLPYIEAFDALGARSTKSFTITATDPNAGNTPPVVVASISPLNGTSPLTVTLSAGVTDNRIVSRVTWFFGDGQSQTVLTGGTTSSSSTVISHVFQSAGTYSPIIQAVDDAGLITLQTFSVTVVDPVNAPPTVNANANPRSGVAPLAVTFTVDTFDDRGLSSASWSFGDGQSAAIPISGIPQSIHSDISHTYLSAGQFNAQVTVTDTDGVSTSKPVQVNVSAPQVDNPPAVNVKASPALGPSPLLVSFAINITDDRQVRTAAILFGDGFSQTVVTNGVTSSVNALVSHTYSSPASYNAVVQATDDAGRASSNSVNVLATDPALNTPPVISAQATPSSGNAPLQVNFLVNATDDSIVASAVLDFGDGRSQLLVQNGFLPTLGSLVPHTYSSPGAYTALLTVTDNQGASSTRSFTILANNPAGNAPPVLVVQTTATGGPVPLTTTFTVNVTDDIFIQDVVINFGDGQSVSVGPNVIVSHTYTIPGVYTVVVNATDNQGASTVRTVVITANNPGGNAPPVIAASVSPTSGLAPLTSVFNASVIDDVQVSSVVWSFGDVTSQSVSPNSQISHVFTAPGVYTAVITAIDNQGAQSTRSFTITALAANQPPVIAAQVAPLSGTAPLLVNFTANVTDDVSVSSAVWAFGDGQSQAVSPNSQISHVFGSAGNFTATLAAVDNQGNQSVRSFAITVQSPPANQPPIVSAQVAPLSGTAPLTSTFTANVTDDVAVSSVVWAFGDGQFQGVASNSRITHQYASAGTYNATVTASDNQGAQAVRSFIVTVTPFSNQPPVISAQVSPLSGNAPLTVTLTANVTDDVQVASAFWAFGDGQSFAVNANSQITHQYAAAGVFNATLTATDNQGVSSTRSFMITVNSASSNAPPTITASVNPLTGLAPLTSTFTANASDDVQVATLVWSFGDGANASIPVGGGPVAITHTYPLAGSYTATITATDNLGASSNRVFTINVNNPAGNMPPVVSASANPSSGAAPLTTTFTLNITDDVQVATATITFGDGSFTVPVQPVGQIAHTYQSPGVFFAVINATDNQGATSSLQVMVTVSSNPAPVVSASVFPMVGTAPLTSVFTANVTDDGAVSQVVWSFGDGQSLQVSPNSQISHTYSAPGSFVATVTATDNQNATTSRSFNLLVNNASGNTAPSIAANVNPTSGVAPLTSTFIANVTDDSQVASVTWFFGDGQSQAVAQNGTLPISNTRIQHSYATNGTFIPLIVAQDNAGATSTQTFVVTVTLPSGNGTNGTANNTAPVIAAQISPPSGLVPLTVTFTANVSDDKGISNVVWFFGDGVSQSVAADSRITHVYSSNGTFVPLIVATDNQGLTSSLSFVVTAFSPSGNGTGNITGTQISVIAAPTSGPAPLAVTFNSSVRDDGLVRSVTWFFGDGQSARVLENGTSSSFSNVIAHAYAAGNFTAVLIVFDDQNQATTFTVPISVGVGNGTQGVLPSEAEIFEVYIPQIRLNGADELSPGRLLTSYITFENRGNTRLENMMAVVSVPELGLRKSMGPVDLVAGDRITKPLVLDLPADAAPGRYWARITVSNSDVRRVLIREITVVGPPVSPAPAVPDTLFVSCPGPSIWCRFFG